MILTKRKNKKENSQPMDTIPVWRRKQNNLQSFRDREVDKQREVVITIPLRGGQGPSRELDEDFIKVIQHEYAVRYLECLGLAATQANIDNVLEKAPLSSCEFTAGWNNSGWLADSIMVCPSKAKKKSFDHCRDQMIEKPKKL